MMKPGHIVLIFIVLGCQNSVYKQNNPEFSIEDGSSTNVSSIDITGDNSLLAIAQGNELRIWSKFEPQVMPQIGFLDYPINHVEFINDTLLLALGSDYITGSEFLLINPTNSRVVSNEKHSRIILENPIYLQYFDELLLTIHPLDEEQLAYGFDPHFRKRPSFLGINLKKLDFTILDSPYTPIQAQSYLNNSRFITLNHPISRSRFSSWDATAKKVIDDFGDDFERPVKFVVSENGQYLAVVDLYLGTILLNLNDDYDRKWIKPSLKRVNEISFSHDNSQLIIINQENHIIKLSVENGQVINDSSFSNEEKFKGFRVLKNRQLFFTYDLAGAIQLWRNSNDKNLTLEIRPISGSEDFIFLTPEKYYMGSPDGVRNGTFKVGSKKTSIFQYDLIFNRPDIVYQSIPQHDEEILDQLNFAVKIRKLNLGQTDISLDTYRPPTISNFEIQTHTDKAEISFLANTGSGLIDRYHIKVNGVPLYGAQGRVLLNERVRTEFELSSGKNIIEVYVTDTNFVSSLILNHEIQVKERTHKPNLFFIGIGFSTERLPADQDIRSVKQHFLNNRNIYGEIRPHIVTGKQILKENALSDIKNLLMQSTPDDVVIGFIVGHGQRNGDEFSILSIADQGGEIIGDVSFREIEQLFDNIPSRNKLLFINACKSGYFLNSDEVTDTQPPYELIKALFLDLQKNTGTNVISSSSSDQNSYFYEDRGIMTEAILQALSNDHLGSDLNGDFIVEVDELKKFVEKRVLELSDGCQEPTSISNNYINNFIVWQRNPEEINYSQLLSGNSLSSESIESNSRRQFRSATTGNCF